MDYPEIDEYLKNLSFDEAGRMTLVQLLEKRVLLSPQVTAVRTPAGHMSYAQWLQQARLVAQRIRQCPAYQPNTAVLVWVDTADARKVASAQHGVLESACMIAPLDDRLSLSEVKLFARDVAATVAIISRGLLLSHQGEDLEGFTLEQLPDEGDPLDLLCFSLEDAVFTLSSVIDTSAARPGADLEASAAPGPGPDDCAVLAFTSGTTGRPKAAMISHGACVQLAERMVNGVFAAPRGGRPVGAKDAIQSPVPAYLPTSIVNTLYSAVLAGCSLSYRGRRFDAAAEEKEMVEAGTTIYAGAPAHYMLMCQRPQSDDSRASGVEVMTISGAPMTAMLYRMMRERWPGAAPANWYALNETMVGQTLNHGEGMEIDPTAIGKPVWPTELAVIDDDGRPCPAGSEGEILLRAPGQMTGYYRNPSETARSLDAQGYIHTADIGYVGKEDGLLRITGRKSDRINRGGFKFYPADVEEVMLGHEGLADAAVLAIPDPVLGQDLVALVVTKEGVVLDEEEIRRYCQERMSRHKVPSRVCFVGQLPRSGFGKVVKKELAALWESQGLDTAG